MSLFKIIIDKKSIKLPAGTTILAGARLAGIYIPTLCSHPDIPSITSEKPIKSIFQGTEKINNTLINKNAKECGLCLVEIEGEEKLINSCEKQIQEGMVIITNSSKIRKKRKENLFPILSRHKHTCLTCSQQEGCSQSQCSSNVPENERCCPQFNNCEFKNVVQHIGIPENTPKWVPTSIPKINIEPLINRDYNLCIGCIRCVRICNKIRKRGSIGFVWDDNGEIQVGTFNESLSTSGCGYCTACIAVCPTGALQDKETTENIIPCKNACPADIDIPNFLRMISLNDMKKALLIIQEKIPFPKILGRICTHPCEVVCRRGQINSPISICALKKFVSENKDNNLTKINLYKNNLFIKETGKKIVIIGGGPAGLTAAFFLRKKGHKIIIYDDKKKPGGMLRYGIPRYRLPENVLNDEINNILNLGIKFIGNQKIGLDLELNQIDRKDNPNAILIAIGAQKDRKIVLKGSEINGILGGINFLKLVAEKKEIKIEKNIIIIGGGNVAIDVAMTAIRYGAEQISIICLEAEKEMPANTWEVEIAKLEGIKIFPSWAPNQVISKNGILKGLDVIKCTSVFDSTGKFNPQCDYKTKKTILGNQIIMAVGQEVDSEFFKKNSLLSKNGLINVNNQNLKTNLAKTYAAGDAISLPGSVIKAIASGKKAAKYIDLALGNDGNLDEILFDRNIKKENIEKCENFIELPREKEPELSINERKNNFREITKVFSHQQAIREAKRCLQCDLRFELNNNPTPPEKLILLSNENIKHFISNETEGVYKIFDKNKNILSIKGTQTLLNDLLSLVENENGIYFEFEKEKMYSKRESELIQKHLQKHGEMPVGLDDDEDLF